MDLWDHLGSKPNTIEVSSKDYDFIKKISALLPYSPKKDIDEYKTYLEKKYDVEYLTARDKAAQEILKNWRNILDIILNYQAHKEWLDYSDRKDDSPFPINFLQPLIDNAREIFSDILKSDVFEKWKEFYSTVDERKAIAKELMDKVKYSIEVDSHRIKAESASIKKTEILVIPNTQSSMREEFLEEIQKSANYSKNFKVIESPYNYRVFIIRELIRWPIKAAVGITEPENSLYSDSLKCNEFPTFHTRKDVNWIPLNSEEFQRIKKVKLFVILGIFFDKIEIKPGKLVINLRNENLELPLDIDKATFDIIKNNEEIIKKLQKNIENERRNLGNSQFIQEILHKKEIGKGNEIPNWDIEEIKNLISEYIQNDEILLKELMKLRPIDEKEKQKLYKKKGDRKPKGGEYEKEGFYCYECGGLIGYTEEEALQNKWVFVGSHKFYEPLSYI